MGCCWSDNSEKNILNKKNQEEKKPNSFIDLYQIDRGMSSNVFKSMTMNYDILVCKKVKMKYMDLAFKEIDVLKKIGVKSIVKNYDLYIYGNHDLKKGSAIIKHNHDHRILMSFFISNMICKKTNIINDKSCVKTSYPTFFKHISQFSN